MGELFGIQAEAILGVMFIFIIILFIIVCIHFIRLGRLRKKYVSMMNGTGVSNLEEVIEQIHKAMARLHVASGQHEEAIRQIGLQMKTMKSKVGIHRYNAFNEQGNDLSFSIAIIDEQQTGIILSGIHNREETYLYAKPLDKGQSKYTLSPEEKAAISQASGTE